MIRLGVELEERVDLSPETRERARRMMGIPAERFTVGWIGRMTAVKRTDDIVLAMKRLLDRGVDACLCLVGDGPDREATEQLAHDLGIVDRCLFLGYQDDVAPFYAAFDALVLPSANEGTPVSAIEALAGGRPVVATRVGGVPDVVRDGVDGFLVEPGDVDALADRLGQLAADPELRAPDGRGGTRTRARALLRRAPRRRRRRPLPQAADGEGPRLGLTSPRCDLAVSSRSFARGASPDTKLSSTRVRPVRSHTGSDDDRFFLDPRR